MPGAGPSRAAFRNSKAEPTNSIAKTAWRPNTATTPLAKAGVPISNAIAGTSTIANAVANNARDIPCRPVKKDQLSAVEVHYLVPKLDAVGFSLATSASRSSTAKQIWLNPSLVTFLRAPFAKLAYFLLLK